MIWYRIDERLVHGQIIEAWLPYLKASCLVIANDGLLGNDLRRHIMLMAVPSKVRTEFLSLKELPSFLASFQESRLNALILFAACGDAQRAYALGVPMEVCNIGNIHYSAEKRRLSAHVAISPEEESCLRFLQNQGVMLDFRSVPADRPALEDWQTP